MEDLSGVDIQKRFAKHIVIHPLYQSTVLPPHDDIAVLKVDPGFKMTKFVGTVCLPAPGKVPSFFIRTFLWKKKVSDRFCQKIENFCMITFFGKSS